ncbi:MAG TPA: TonB family protein [Pyrinomonadaceae bacterium]|nr:TonB family protein [Pyrinomonadaceae bacterium]
MFRYLSTIGFVTVTTLMCVLAVNGQKLTARVGSLQPQPIGAAVESDRVRDGLVGPVRRVRTEIVKLTSQDGRVIEGKRSLLEIVAYDLKGNKVENQYFPVSGGTLTGKEVYKYDEKGNISEMTLVNGDGTLLSKEVYRYEFDFAGNWNKMTTSVAVVDGGRVSFEPSEVTYRSIMYYLDENMVRMVQPPAAPSSQPAPTNSVARNTAAKSSPGSSPAATKSGNQAAPPLPKAMDRVNDINSSEVKATPTSGDQGAQQVVMEAEPPSPAFSPILKPVSGGVLNGTAISLPTPLYPDTAKRMRISGIVAVSVVVDETGKVISAEATSGPAQLREAARQAASRARFSPTKLSGQPVKVSGLINYKFALSQ